MTSLLTHVQPLVSGAALASIADARLAGRAIASLFQTDPGGFLGSDTTLFMVFMGVIAAAALVQLLIFVAMAVAGAKMEKKLFATIGDMKGTVTELRSELTPVLMSAKDMLEDLSPKLKAIGANAVAVSETLRDKSAALGYTVEEIAERTRQQAARVDGMVSDTLDSVNNVTSAIERGILVPVRQAQGVLNGLRAGLDVLLGKDRTSYSRSGSRNDDMFI